MGKQDSQSPSWPTNGNSRPAKQSGLRWRIVGVLLLVALIPLGLVGVGASVVFGGMLFDKTMELQRSIVQRHSSVIDLYLQERLRALELVARSHSLELLNSEAVLPRIFDALQESHPKAFVDIGVIGSDGKHLSYVGPFNLKGKKYRRAEWFRIVMSQGFYVSDVFLGFRQVPHCVIAVKRKDGEQVWILRATINSDNFNSLVRTGQMGKTGDAYIINTKGRYQTPPRRGRVLTSSLISSPRAHQGVRDERIAGPSGKRILRSTTWLNDRRWMLVVEQEEGEIRAPVRQAMAWGTLVILIAVVLLVVTTLLATWHLTSRIDRANQERDEMQRDLLRSAKLASIGELATGLAHEINNPLAVISAETTNLGDQIEDLELEGPVREGLEKSVDRCKRMVKRCSGITSKMLQFGHKTESRLKPTVIAPLLRESVRMLQQQARVRNIDLQLDIEPHLPRPVLDSTELEQVLVNLINNAMDAINGRGVGVVKIAARHTGTQVRLSVSDSGGGIAPADLDRIFQPFFTTKPIGKGTGLGLSVCYGIVHGWGGTIEAESTLGTGTVMTVVLPVQKGETVV